jgi:hypothetical protein
MSKPPYFQWFPRVLKFIPKPEIKSLHLPQSPGRKLIEKFSPDRCGYGYEFFNEFPLQYLAPSESF